MFADLSVDSASGQALEHAQRIAREALAEEEALNGVKSGGVVDSTKMGGVGLVFVEKDDDSGEKIVHFVATGSSADKAGGDGFRGLVGE